MSKKNNREEQIGGADKGNSGSRTSGYCTHASLSESFQSPSMCSLPQHGTMTSVS